MIVHVFNLYCVAPLFLPVPYSVLVSPECLISTPNLYASGPRCWAHRNTAAKPHRSCKGWLLKKE
ncbi:hypothetical protein IscW_ISCW003368 [Ixodes scapularis]|uniref:Secreted protein n=1 Tax=Ixodes scapularis TaxID=6945 RepID=B7PB97_IXOSC|nr:hypothetical protein IscW_ISCW003368 [Ixodes scapularis]|eukprot:XP_002407828.1 hypothetical protein IscW_ISCW003368 [Ixodes scapularis]